MSLFDENSPHPQDESDPAQQTPETPTGPLPVNRATESPISYTEAAPATELQDANLPEDLRISWSWGHLLVFGIFFITLQFAIGGAVLAYYSFYRQIPQKQLQQLLESDPKLLVGSSIVMFALIFLFLYMTLAVLRDMPFWRTLGWRKLESNPATGKGKPWMYLLSGCGLSLFVLIASSRVKEADHMPIQELFKSRTGAFSLMAMAVLIAPLVEETVFRGYLYPTFVRIISAVVNFVAVHSARASRVSVITSTMIMAAVFGVFRNGRLALTCGVLSLLILIGIILVVVRIIGKDSGRAARAAISSSIILTGTLFGLMHGTQLGWTWGLVGLLTLVGVIFTFARAWTGTVFASFLLHLGYNSMIALTSIIATKGFTQMPPHP